MPNLPGSAVGSRLPSTYRPPGTNSVAPASGLPGQSYRELGNRLRDSGALQRNYSPPRATGTYRAPKARPPATYTRGGIPPTADYSRNSIPRPPDPTAAYQQKPFGTPSRPQIPRPAIKPRPSPTPLARGGRIPRGVGGSAVAGGAIAGIRGAVAAGSVLANGGSVPEAVGAGVGTAVGSVAGGAVGAAIGTAIAPGVGTAIGGAVGSAVGGWVGGQLGEELGDWVDGEDIPTEGITGNPPPPGAGEPYSPEEWLGSFPEGEIVDFTPYGGVAIRYRSGHSPPHSTKTENVSSIRITSIDTGPIIRWVRCPSGFVWIEPMTAGSLQFEGVDVCEFPQDIPQKPGSIDRPTVLGAPSATAPPPLPTPRSLPGGGTDPLAPASPAPSRVPPGDKPQPLPAPAPAPVEVGDPVPAPAATPDNVPAPAPGTRPALLPDSGTLTKPTTFTTPDGDFTVEASPENPYKYEVQPDGSVELIEISPAEIPQWDYLPDWAKEELQRRAEANTIPQVLPTAATAVGAAIALAPVPTASTKTTTLPGPQTAITDPITNGVRPPAAPPKQYPTSTAGNCRCNLPMLANQQKIINMLNQSTGTPVPSNATPPSKPPATDAISLAAIMQKLNEMQQFAAKAWETTRLQKVLDVLTFMGVMHNVAYLSRDVGETFMYVVSQGLGAIGIRDEEDNLINVQQIVGSSVENFLRSVLGNDVYEGVRDTWNKASSIFRSASMIVWTIRSIADSTLDLMEWVAENTGKIGNALKRFGVVGERAYPWMSERAQARNKMRARFSKLTDSLENAEDRVSSYAIATSGVLEVQDEISELGENWIGFRETVEEAVPDPWDDNTPVQTEFETGSDLSESPDIQSSDTSRG